MLNFEKAKQICTHIYEREASIRILELELKRTQKELDNKDPSLGKCNKELTALRRKLAGFEAALASAQTQLAVLQAELRKLESELVTTLAALEKSNEEKKAAMKFLNDIMDALERCMNECPPEARHGVDVRTHRDLVKQGKPGATIPPVPAIAHLPPDHPNYNPPPANRHTSI